MPEYRGGSGSPMVLILILLAVIVVVGVVIYLLLGNNAVAPAPTPPAAAAPAVQPIQPAPQPVMAQPTAAPPPAAPQEQNNTADQLYPKPQVLFGEIITEGFVDLELITGRVHTYYTFQVDTSTQNIILFFAMYDSTGLAISRSVVVEDYSQSQLIDNAQVTIYYPNAPETLVYFDRPSGSWQSSQFYSTIPHGPGMFSPQMRIALVKQNLPLVNEDSNIIATMQLDPIAVASTSGYQVTVNDQVTTDAALAEIQAIIDQLESRRPRS